MREWIFFEKFFHRKFAYLLSLAQRIVQLFRKTHTNTAYAHSHREWGNKNFIATIKKPFAKNISQ